VEPREATAENPGERRIGQSNVSAAERQERSEAVERLLIAGVSPLRIKALVYERFGMSDGAVHGVVERVRERWRREEADSRATYKATAMRRLYGHIAEARASKHWPAVAQLERLLAEMQGTREPVEVAMNITATLGESAARVVAQLTPEKMAALIAEQRQLRALAAGRQVIETTGVEVQRGQAPAKGERDGEQDDGGRTG
jgi:hypothetical protein